MNQALSTIKVALNNNFDVAVHHGIGKGHATMIMEEIRNNKAASIILNGDFIDALVTYIRSEDGSLAKKVPEDLFAAEVIVIANIDLFSKTNSEVINSIITDRRALGQALDKLKTIIILSNSFEKLMNEVNTRDFNRPVILSIF